MAQPVRVNNIIEDNQPEPHNIVGRDLLFSIHRDPLNPLKLVGLAQVTRDRAGQDALRSRLQGCGSPSPSRSIRIRPGYRTNRTTAKKGDYGKPSSGTQSVVGILFDPTCGSYLELQAEPMLHPTFKSHLQQELWFKLPFFEAPFQADLGEEMKIQGFGLMRPTLRGLTF